MGLIIILILIGVLLLLTETLLIPGMGIAGILGIASFVGACYYAFAKLGTFAGILVTIIIICLVVGMLMVILRSKTWKKLELNEVIDKKGVEETTVAVGDRGRTTTRLAPMGSARIGDKPCEVTSTEGMIDAETEIEVVRVEKNKIFVKKAE